MLFASLALWACGGMVATDRLATALGLRLLTSPPRVFAVVALVAWSEVFLGLVRSISRAQGAAAR